MNEIDPPFETRRRLFRLEADQFGEATAAFRNVVADVVLVNIAVESVERDQVSPVDALQSRFGEFSVGDVLSHAQNLQRHAILAALENQVAGGDPPPST